MLKNRVLQVTMATDASMFTRMEDRALLDAAKHLVIEEHIATAALLRALMEIDTRRLYLGEGCASMFSYCTQVLHLAEGAAYNRIEAARAARSYPLILELFEQGAITLTAVRLLGPHLTAENHVAVLSSATHKSKREIEELVCALKPRPDAPIVVRRLATPRAVLVQPLASVPSAPSAIRVGATPSAVECRRARVPVPEPSPSSIALLAPERYRIQLTVSRETHDKFRRAQALLRHALPSGDAAEIFDRAVTLLVDQLERQRFAQTERARAPKLSPGPSRHIPAAVRRAVWRRDGGCCAFVGTEGRCGERGFLELHHVEPYAVGGAATVENIELRCRSHNGYEARLFFGPDVVREERARWADSFRNELIGPYGVCIDRLDRNEIRGSLISSKSAMRGARDNKAAGSAGGLVTLGRRGQSRI